ncbi:hypothetical protein Tco_1435001, partial [Tanacetum coccineum]
MVTWGVYYAQSFGVFTVLTTKPYLNRDEDIRWDRKDDGESKSIKYNDVVAVAVVKVEEIEEQIGSHVRIRGRTNVIQYHVRIRERTNVRHNYTRESPGLMRERVLENKS